MSVWWFVASVASIAYMVLMSGSSQALYYNPRGRGVFGRNTQPPLVLSAQTPDRGLLLGYPRSGLDGPGPRFRPQLFPTTTTTSSTTSLSEYLLPTSDIDLELDDSQKSNLSLTVKWRFKSGKKVSRYVLKIDFLLFGFYFTIPVIETKDIYPTNLEPQNFFRRREVASVSKNNCSLNCIESLDCNIVFYNWTHCVLYSYDFERKNGSVNLNDEEYHNEDNLIKELQSEEIHDLFVQDCQSSGVNHSTNCFKIEFPTETIVSITTSKLYKFSLKLRDENSVWTDGYVVKEFRYDPNIFINVTGDVRPGGNVKLECSTDLDPSKYASIKWNGYASNQTLELKPMTWRHFEDSFECEVRASTLTSFRKRIKINLIVNATKPTVSLKMNVTKDVESSRVQLNWSFDAPYDQLNPEKIKIMYSANDKPFALIKAYSLFQSSAFDYSSLYGATEVTTNSEDACMLKCIEDSNCNNYVYFYYLRSDNCELSKSDLFLSRRSCSANKACSKLISYNSTFPKNSVSLSVMPNTTYRFKIQVKDKYLNWSEEVVSEPVRIPLEINLVPTLTENNGYELQCSTNVKTVHRQSVEWYKDAFNLYWRTDLPFKENSSHDESFSRLVFDFKKSPNFNFNGLYTCLVRFFVSDVTRIYEQVSFNTTLNIDHFGSITNSSLNYSTSAQNLSMPAVPGSFMVIPCRVKGSPIDSLTWLINGTKFSKSPNFHIDFDEQVGDQKARLFLILNKTLPMTKFECVLNGNVTIRTHFIEFFDEKPDYEAKLDLSELNNLKVKINLVKKNKATRLPVSLIPFDTPLKLSVLYVQNDSFREPNAVYLAPRVFSLTELRNPSELNDAINIGSITSRKYKGSMACKLWCFTTPYCSSYEYHHWDETCKLFHSTSHDDLFQRVLTSMNQTYGMPVDSMLIEFPYFDPRVLAEQEDSWPYKIIKPEEDDVCWSKSRSGQWQLAHPTGSYDQGSDEASCRNKLLEYNSTYVFDKLIPGMNFQFKIQVASLFGTSEPIFTDNITVPFVIDPIVERNETKEGQESYVLVCSTPLIATTRLQFTWYKEGQAVNTSYKQELKQPTSQNPKFSSELRLEGQRHQFDGLYECQLAFQGSSEFNTLKQNTSYLFASTVPVSYQNYPDSVSDVTENHGFEDMCEVDGRPLPNVEWRFNGSVMPNTLRSVSSQPHRPFFMNHLYSSTRMRSKLYVSSMTKDFQGPYSCVLVKNDGSVAYVKNITLRMAPSSAATVAGHRSFSATFLLVLLVIVVAVGAISAGFLYYKKTRGDVRVMFKYNNLTTGSRVTQSTQQLNLNDQNEEEEEEEGQGL